MGRILDKCVVKPGYKGEWVVEYPPYQQEEIIAWCRECLGEDGHSYKYRWRNQWAGDNKYRLFLRHESDVTMFVLRWS